ncbi:MAG TPA: hypothetical protein VJ483_07790, partial [Holophagaceae bacterium]|nr:hypothetical protein [Holophagaceae bacterium]
LPEVMVYAELLEVTESSLQKVGLLPVFGATDDAGIYRLGATTVNNNGGVNTNNSNLSIKTADIRVLFPNLALDFLKSNGDARMVASPNLRVVSGNKGELMIGDKISTTQSSLGVGGLGTGATGATGTAGGIAGALGSAGLGQTQYGYEDVGVKISVEPRVHYNDEISLKLEASVTTQKAGSTPGRPDLGRREIKTFARLRDGETVIFGGLLKDEEQKQLQGIWGLSEIPIINRLLGNTHTTKAKTDVILTLRAVLVRKPNFSEDDFKGFNPDDATSKQGPFAPKPAPKKAATVSTTTATAPAPAAPKTPPPPPPAPAKAPDAAQAAADATAASVAAKEAAQPPASSDLVFFVSPTTAELGQGEHIEVALSVSGGKGLNDGYLDLRMPPGLKLVAVSAGDFLTTDGGGIQQSSTKEGLLRLGFKRGGQGGDSGTLAVIELEATQPGNAPVLIEGGQFLAGGNPISARWVNALYNIH